MNKCNEPAPISVPMDECQAAFVDEQRLFQGQLFYGVTPWSFVNRSSEDLMRDIERQNHNQVR